MIRDDEPVPEWSDEDVAEIAAQLDFALAEQGEFDIDTMPIERRLAFIARRQVEEIVSPRLC